MWWAQHCGYFSGYWLWCLLASPDRRAGSHWWDWATNYKSSEDNREHSCPCFLEAKNLNISKNWTEYSVHLYQIYNRVSEQLLRHIYVFVMKNVFNVFGRDNVPVWMTNEKNSALLSYHDKWERSLYLMLQKVTITWKPFDMEKERKKSSYFSIAFFPKKKWHFHFIWNVALLIQSISYHTKNTSIILKKRILISVPRRLSFSV